MGSTDRANCWSLTINNPTPADDECIAQARARGWKVDGQKEQGEESGTIHYQICLTTGQVRFSAVKKMFPRARIEIAREKSALLKYVNKQETRVGSLPTTTSKYPSSMEFWKLITTELMSYEIPKEHRIMDGEDRPYWEATWDAEKSYHFACAKLIRKGFHIDVLCMNPQIRKFWLIHTWDIVYRAYIERQTDRQTAEDLVATINIPTTEDADDNETEDGGEEESGLSGSGGEEDEDSDDESQGGDCGEGSEEDSESDSGQED